MTMNYTVEGLAEAAERGGRRMPRYLTTAEVASYCRAAPETVRYWRHIGTGPAHFKCGRRVLYDPADVEAWFVEQRAASARG